MQLRNVASAPATAGGESVPSWFGAVIGSLSSPDDRGPAPSLEEVGAVLATLFAMVPIGVALSNRDMRYVQLNERLAALNGMPASVHLGRAPHELFPEQGPIWEVYWRQVLTTGEPLTDVPRSRVIKGAVRHILVSCYPVRINQAEVAGVLTLVNDITERKLAETALQRLYREVDVAARVAEEERALSEALIAAAPAGVAVVDAELCVHRMNARFAAVAGLAEADFRRYDAQLHAEQATARLVAAAGLTGREGGGFALSELLPAFAGAVAPLVAHVMGTGEPMLEHELWLEPGPDASGQRGLRLSLLPVRLAGGHLARAGMIMQLSALAEPQ